MESWRKRHQRKKEQLMETLELCRKQIECEENRQQFGEEREEHGQDREQSEPERAQGKQENAQSKEDSEQCELDKKENKKDSKDSKQCEWENELSCRNGEEREYRIRLQTFDKWPVDHLLSPSVLAEAGFAWIGVGDKVACAVCSTMWSWSDCVLEEGDDPWVDHATKYPPCAFVRRKKGSAFIAKNQITDCDTNGKPLKIKILLKYCSIAGIRFDYSKLVEDCVTYKDRTDKLLALLHEAGIEGEINMGKVMAIHNKRKHEEEEKRRQKMELYKQKREQRRQETGQRRQETKQREQGKEQNSRGKEQIGQEKELSRQEREQSVQKKEEYGQKGVQRGVEKEQRGQEREQNRQERDQSGRERKQRGQGREESGQESQQSRQDREHRGEEKEQRGQEREQNRQETDQSGREREQRVQEKEEYEQKGVQCGVEKEQRGQEREQNRQERDQSGRDRKQRVQEKEEYGQKGVQRGVEKEQRGQEGEQNRQETDQSGREREQRGQDKEQREQDEEQRGQKRQQRGRQNLANRNSKLQVKKRRSVLKSAGFGVQNDSIILHDIITIARNCSETIRGSVVNLIASLPHGPANLQKRRANEVKTPAKKAKLSCEKCSKTFTNKYLLEKHIAQHDPSCEECGELFTDTRSLSKHRKTCGKSAVIKGCFDCAHCNKCYSSEKFLVNHIKGEHDQTVSICDTCGAYFSFISSLVEHQKTCGNDETPQENTKLGPQQWCSEKGGYEANVEASPRKDTVEQRAAQRLGQPSEGKSYQNLCKLCFSEGPYDLQEHYIRVHEVPDPLSMLCNDRTSLVPTTKNIGSDWFCTQLAKAMERYTDTVCRLCERSKRDLVSHYVKHHKVENDLLYFTKRLFRKDGLIVVN